MVDTNRTVNVNIVATGDKDILKQLRDIKQPQNVELNISDKDLEKFKEIKQLFKPTFDPSELIKSFNTAMEAFETRFAQAGASIQKDVEQAFKNADIIPIIKNKIAVGVKGGVQGKIGLEVGSIEVVAEAVGKDADRINKDLQTSVNDLRENTQQYATVVKQLFENIKDMTSGGFVIPINTKTLQDDVYGAIKAGMDKAAEEGIVVPFKFTIEGKEYSQAGLRFKGVTELSDKKPSEKPQKESQPKPSKEELKPEPTTRKSYESAYSDKKYMGITNLLGKNTSSKLYTKAFDDQLVKNNYSRKYGDDVDPVKMLSDLVYKHGYTPDTARKIVFAKDESEEIMYRHDESFSSRKKRISDYNKKHEDSPLAMEESPLEKFFELIDDNTTHAAIAELKSYKEEFGDVFNDIFTGTIDTVKKNIESFRSGTFNKNPIEEVKASVNEVVSNVKESVEPQKSEETKSNELLINLTKFTDGIISQLSDLNPKRKADKELTERLSAALGMISKASDDKKYFELSNLLRVFDGSKVSGVTKAINELYTTIIEVLSSYHKSIAYSSKQSQEPEPTPISDFQSDYEKAYKAGLKYFEAQAQASVDEDDTVDAKYLLDLLTKDEKQIAYIFEEGADAYARMEDFYKEGVVEKWYNEKYGGAKKESPIVEAEKKQVFETPDAEVPSDKLLAKTNLMKWGLPENIAERLSNSDSIAKQFQTEQEGNFEDWITNIYPKKPYSSLDLWEKSIEGNLRHNNELDWDFENNIPYINLDGNGPKSPLKEAAETKVGTPDEDKKEEVKEAAESKVGVESKKKKPVAKPDFLGYERIGEEDSIFQELVDIKGKSTKTPMEKRIKQKVKDESERARLLDKWNRLRTPEEVYTENISKLGAESISGEMSEHEKAYVFSDTANYMSRFGEIFQKKKAPINVNGSGQEGQALINKAGEKPKEATQLGGSKETVKLSPEVEAYKLAFSTLTTQQLRTVEYYKNGLEKFNKDAEAFNELGIGSSIETIDVLDEIGKLAQSLEEFNKTGVVDDTITNLNKLLKKQFIESEEVPEKKVPVTEYDIRQQRKDYNRELGIMIRQKYSERYHGLFQEDIGEIESKLGISGDEIISNINEMAGKLSRARSDKSKNAIKEQIQTYVSGLQNQLMAYNEESAKKKKEEQDAAVVQGNKDYATTLGVIIKDSISNAIENAVGKEGEYSIPAKSELVSAAKTKVGVEKQPETTSLDERIKELEGSIAELEGTIIAEENKTYTRSDAIEKHNKRLLTYKLNKQALEEELEELKNNPNAEVKKPERKSKRYIPSDSYMQLGLATQLFDELRGEMAAEQKGSNITRVRSHYGVDKNGEITMQGALYARDDYLYKPDLEQYGENTLRYAYGYKHDNGDREAHFNSLKAWDKFHDDDSYRYAGSTGTTIGKVPEGTDKLTKALQDYILIDTNDEARQKRYDRVIQLLNKRREGKEQTESPKELPVVGAAKTPLVEQSRPIFTGHVETDYNEFEEFKSPNKKVEGVPYSRPVMYNPFDEFVDDGRDENELNATEKIIKAAQQSVVGNPSVTGGLLVTADELEQYQQYQEELTKKFASMRAGNEYIQAEQGTQEAYYSTHDDEYVPTALERVLGFGGYLKTSRITTGNEVVGYDNPEQFGEISGQTSGTKYSTPIYYKDKDGNTQRLGDEFTLRREFGPSSPTNEAQQFGGFENAYEQYLTTKLVRIQEIERSAEERMVSEAETLYNPFERERYNAINAAIQNYQPVIDYQPDKTKWNVTRNGLVNSVKEDTGRTDLYMYNKHLDRQQARDNRTDLSSEITRGLFESISEPLSEEQRGDVRGLIREMSTPDTEMLTTFQGMLDTNEGQIEALNSIYDNKGAGKFGHQYGTQDEYAKMKMEAYGASSSPLGMFGFDISELSENYNKPVDDIFSRFDDVMARVKEYEGGDEKSLPYLNLLHAKEDYASGLRSGSPESIFKSNLDMARGHASTRENKEAHPKEKDGKEPVSIIGDLKKFFKNPKEMFGKSIEASKEKLWGGFKNFAKLLPATALTGLATGLVSLLKQGITSIIQTGIKIIGISLKPLKLIFKGFKGLLDKAISQSKTISNMIELAVMPLLLIVEFTLLPVLLALIDPFKNMITWVVENKEELMGIGEALGDLIVPFANIILNVLESIDFTKLASMIETLKEAAGDTEKQIGIATDIVFEFAGIIVSKASDVLDGFLKAFNKWWDYEEDGIKTNQQKVADLIQSIIEKGLDIAKEYIRTNSQIIADTITLITQRVSEILKDESFKDILAAVSEAIQALIKLVITVLKDPIVWDTVKSLVKEIFTIFKEAFDELIWGKSLSTEETKALETKVNEAQTQEERTKALQEYARTVSTTGEASNRTWYEEDENGVSKKSIYETIENAVGESVRKLEEDASGNIIGYRDKDWNLKDLTGTVTQFSEYLTSDVESMARVANKFADYGWDDKYQTQTEYLDSWLEGKLNVSIDLNIDENNHVVGYKANGNTYDLSGKLRTTNTGI